MAAQSRCRRRAKMRCSRRCGCSSGCPIRPSSPIAASARWVPRAAGGRPGARARLPSRAQPGRPPHRLRRRQTLEEAGLLERVGVDVHPDPDAPGDRVRRGRVQRPGLADEPSLRPRLPGGRGVHGRPEEAHEGRRVHEDAAPAAHLLELRLRSIDGGEDAAPGGPRGRGAGEARSRTP